MSTAHGAGLMVAPVLLGAARARSAAATTTWPMLAGGPLDIAAVGHRACTSGRCSPSWASIAFFVYERVGLQILRRAWLNTDQVWAGAFVLAGLVTLTS